MPVRLLLYFGVGELFRDFGYRRYLKKVLGLVYAGFGKRGFNLLGIYGNFFEKGLDGEVFY